MKTTILLFALIFTAFLGITAEAKSATPEEVVKEIYKIHAADWNGTGDRILDTRESVGKYFETKLADILWKHLNADPDKEDIVDFDIFYNAQDAEIKSLKVAPAKIVGKKATVVVTFKNFGKAVKITYSMVNVGGDWKISDIGYGKETLRTIFK